MQEELQQEVKEEIKEEKPKRKRFDYLWIMIPLCYITYGICFGFCSSGRSLYLTAITEALGFKRGDFALNDTFRYVTSIVVNLFFGYLINKFGAKKLLISGIFFMIAFTIINSVAEDLWLFYVGGFFLGLAVPLTGTTMMSVVLNRWVTKNKGVVIGLVLSANALGSAIAVQIITPILFNAANPFGYRTSYRLVTYLLVIIVVLVAIFFRSYPKGAVKTAEPTKRKRKQKGESWVGIDYNEVVKKPYFYMVATCMAFTGFSLVGIAAIGVPYMYDLGMPESVIANASTIGSLMLMATKAMTGFVNDKFGLKASMNICFISGLISICGLPLLSNTPLGIAVAYIRPFFSQIATPLETIMIPFFVTELFGNKSFDKVIGIYLGASSLGMAIGSPVTNYCYDIFGSYSVIIIAYTTLLVAVLIIMNVVLKYANRDKQKILQSLMPLE